MHEYYEGLESNEKLHIIEQFINDYYGTRIGWEVKNMLDNDTPLDFILDYIDR